MNSARGTDNCCSLLANQLMAQLATVIFDQTWGDCGKTNQECVGEFHFSVESE